jgi:transketolase
LESKSTIGVEFATKSIQVDAKTVKGIGTKKTAESATGAHGFPLKSPTELAAFLTEIYATDSYPQEFSAWTEELIQWEKELKAKAKN